MKLYVKNGREELLPREVVLDHRDPRVPHLYDNDNSKVYSLWWIWELGEVILVKNIAQCLETVLNVMS